jgi:hypothetical protein
MRTAVGREGPYGYAYKITANGTFSWRLRKELPDGRIAVLELGAGDVSAQDYLDGLLLRRKLESAVFAAQYWKRRAMAARSASSLAGGLLGIGGSPGLWLLGQMVGKKP